jgi:hypothetical protein
MLPLLGKSVPVMTLIQLFIALPPVMQPKTGSSFIPRAVVCGLFLSCQQDFYII